MFEALVQGNYVEKVSIDADLCSGGLAKGRVNRFMKKSDGLDIEMILINCSPSHPKKLITLIVEIKAIL